MNEQPTPRTAAIVRSCFECNEPMAAPFVVLAENLERESAAKDAQITALREALNRVRELVDWRRSPSPSGFHYVEHVTMRNLQDVVERALANPPLKSGTDFGKLTITTNEAGDVVAVTSTDDEGRILKTFWERKQQSERRS